MVKVQRFRWLCAFFLVACGDSATDTSVGGQGGGAGGQGGSTTADGGAGGSGGASGGSGGAGGEGGEGASETTWQVDNGADTFAFSRAFYGLTAPSASASGEWELWITIVEGHADP